MGHDTYTVREPGCTAWVEHVDLATALREHAGACDAGATRAMVIRDRDSAAMCTVCSEVHTVADCDAELVDPS